MKLFGPDAVLTDLAQMIMAEDIEALENQLAKGLDINGTYEFTKYIDETPVVLALCENKYNVLDWLLAKKVNLNDQDNPAIIMASSNCDPEILKLLIEHGADVNAKHRIGKSAIGSALYGEKYENISFLLENGYELHKDGSALRQAVSDRQTPAIKIFLDYGIDVNFCKPDMVYPYNSTPVHLAAQNNDLATLKLLVAHGADVTKKDDFGERPYDCAVQNENEAMIEYIRSLEPKEWHDEEQKLIHLQQYQIPEQLLAVLQSNDRRIETPENEYVKYIEFNSLLQLKEVDWRRKKFIDLLDEVDNYWSQGFLVWYPKNQCLAFADYEHETFTELCTVEEFFANPSAQIDKIFE